MTAVWLPPARLAERRAAAQGPLAPLAASLARDLEPVLARDLALPPEKARLSRAGGRCPVDGAFLRFDPFAPHRHECPRCGRAYDDAVHYRWWIMGYHLWLAERAVHAAALHALLGDARHHAFAEMALARYAEAYLRWPNQDNVLGPTRPFFSTYLESIWLLQLCVALDLLESVGRASPLGDVVRDRLVAPSAALVASYPEGDSNRQVWNGAALLAAAALLGDDALARRAVDGPGGLRALLAHALLADGSWYEGENYHLFAHRGLWYGVQLAAARGVELEPQLLRRFDEGFAVPFLTALPDYTFPARRDSQYAVSLRQWRFAELAELGLARRPEDRRLHHALARLYDPGVPSSDTGRWRSTAEAERNEPAAALDRTALGWRSLLFAIPELPTLRPATPASVLLEAQGLAVLRRDAGRVYAALDYGTSGGGHGHPDRLDLLLSVGDERWLDDPGTGSYVDPSLFWYRSTLAHPAPMVNGRSQRRANGVLLAWEDRGGAGWVDALVAGAAPGVVLRRTAVVLPGYLVDELSWEADREVRVELPLGDAAAPVGALDWRPVDVAALEVEGGEQLRGAATAAWPEDGLRLSTGADVPPRAIVLGSAPQACWRATAPGAPGREPRQLHVARTSGRAGRLVTVWSWAGAVVNATLDGDALCVTLAGGEAHRHLRCGARWHVDLTVGAARSSIDLGGATALAAAGPSLLAMAAKLPAAAPAAAGAPVERRWEPLDAPRRYALGAEHYRRSEQSWEEAGRPTAVVELEPGAGALRVAVRVRTPHPCFVPAGAENDMDNERPDVNGDGVQLHLVLPDLATADEPAPQLAWLFVPESSGALRVIPLGRQAERAAPPPARWTRAADGYAVHAELPLRALCGAAGQGGAGLRFALDVLVNESAPGRERRRGQLVLSGARGEFVYLRGDRHAPDRCLPFLLADD